jgi:UDP-galactopyranose mutase
MSELRKEIVVVGAGISGCVLAERYAHKGKKVLLIEKRSHIGGNCYDYINDFGILISGYGAHLFHTNFDDVWEYVHQFSDWRTYKHRVVSKIGDQLVPVPVNRITVNKLFGLCLSSESQMIEWLSKNQVQFAHEPRNSEEAALAQVGTELYGRMFKHYTKKQWDKYPIDLDASVLQRIPVRIDDDEHYFVDKHQALPIGGYTKMFQRMLDHPNIELRLNTDFLDVRDILLGWEKLFYTGPIDQYFRAQWNSLEPLEYRSLRFVEETIETEDFQGHSVINYPDPTIPYTRVVEYKHITGQKHKNTTIVREYGTSEGEPYYPGTAILKKSQWSRPVSIDNFNTSRFSRDSSVR